MAKVEILWTDRIKSKLHSELKTFEKFTLFTVFYYLEQDPQIINIVYKTIIVIVAFCGSEPWSLNPEERIGFIFSVHEQ